MLSKYSFYLQRNHSSCTSTHTHPLYHHIKSCIKIVESATLIPSLTYSFNSFSILCYICCIIICLHSICLVSCIIRESCYLARHHTINYTSSFVLPFTKTYQRGMHGSATRREDSKIYKVENNFYIACINVGAQKRITVNASKKWLTKKL